MFSRLPSHNTRIAIAASPDPRNTALIRNNSTTVTLPPSMTWVNRCPERITSGEAPITCNRLDGARRGQNGDRAATMTPSRIDWAAARDAPSASCWPMRRDTSAIAPIDSPIAAV